MSYHRHDPDRRSIESCDPTSPRVVSFGDSYLDQYVTENINIKSNHLLASVESSSEVEVVVK